MDSIPPRLVVFQTYLSLGVFELLDLLLDLHLKHLLHFHLHLLHLGHVLPPLLLHLGQRTPGDTQEGS